MAECQNIDENIADATSTADIIQAVGQSRDCYKQTVDSHAADIDKLRTDAGGFQLAPPSLTTQQAFDNYRATKSSATAAPKLAWCDLGSAVDANFGGSQQRVDDVDCQAQIESRLAKLVASVTTLPGNPVALTVSPATAADLQTFVPELVKEMNANTPGDTSAYTAQVQETIAAVVAASGELCAVLEDAGEMAGGSGSQQLIQGCMSDALGLISAELTNWTASPERQ
jgi:hypothetical protein